MMQLQHQLSKLINLYYVCAVTFDYWMHFLHFIKHYIYSQICFTGADPEIFKGGAQSILDTNQFFQMIFKSHMVKQIK